MAEKELLRNLRCPRWEELPNIDLYMDQVLTFLNEHLESINILNDEKQLTSSMVNNYVKHGIVDKPIKKKYNRTHLIYIYVVCFLKKIYSMDEISTLIKIQVRTSEIEGAYNAFCDEVEHAIDYLYNPNNHEPVVNSEDGETMQLLKTTINSVVTALFVQEMILEAKKIEQMKKVK